MKAHGFVLSGCWRRSHSLDFVFESLQGSEGQFCTFLSSSPRTRLGFGSGAGTGAGGAFPCPGLSVPAGASRGVLCCVRRDPVHSVLWLRIFPH